MTKVTIAVLLIFTFLSCNTETAKEDNQPFRAPLREKRELSNSERVTAHNICLALDDKQKYFEENPFLQLEFETSEVSCGGNGFSSPQIATAQLEVPTVGDMRLRPQKGELLTDILTDDQGVLSDICRAIGNERVFNRYKINGKIYQFSFGIIDGFEGFDVTRFRIDQSGRPSLDLKERYMIYTPRVNDNPRNLDGVVYERQRATACPDGRRTFRQIFKKFN